MKDDLFWGSFHAHFILDLTLAGFKAYLDKRLKAKVVLDYQRGQCGGGVNWETGVDLYTLQYRK